MIIEKDSLINVLIANASNGITTTELSNWQVVAVHRETGKPQFATILAPSQEDADDFVADMAQDWIVIRDNKDLLDDTN
jgi:hypothetical protein